MTAMTRSLASRSSIVGVLALGVLALGCRDRSTTTPEPAPIERCGEPGERFGELDWVPADARLLVVVDRRASDLTAADQHLRELSQHAATTGLPIRAALALGQIGMQTQMLGMSLTKLEVDPGEIVELHGPTREVAWVWPTTCAPELLAARVLGRWGVLLRANLDAELGSGDASFPFDVVVPMDGLVALTPLGQGAELLRWLRSAEGREGPGSQVTALAPAALRGVIQGESLLAGEAEADAGRGPAHVRTLRATGEAIELDGTVWRPPP